MERISVGDVAKDRLDVHRPCPTAKAWKIWRTGFDASLVVLEATGGYGSSSVCGGPAPVVNARSATVRARHALDAAAIAHFAEVSRQARALSWSRSS